ncbi:MAG: M81 family metallopeptidase [Planctomycetes bacterium]|nr:M81 family metallopeptidase [Planctomycetota bacterium]
MKIISGGIQHETNMFSDTPTTLEDFIRDTHLGDDLPGGEAILKRFADTNTIHGGYLAGVKETGLELVPVLNTRAYPSGMVLRDCFEHLSGILIQRTRNALPADGILLDLHGAMITEDYEDAEAEIVRRVRTLVGPDFPIVVTLDLHANISPALPDYATVIIGYDTYPHTDMGDRGKEAVILLDRILKHDIQPVQAYRQLPLLTLPPGQCTMREPMQSVIRELHELESRPGMLTATVAMGFPFADIHDMGVRVLAPADVNLSPANPVAAQVAVKLWI